MLGTKPAAPRYSKPRFAKILTFAPLSATQLLLEILVCKSRWQKFLLLQRLLRRPGARCGAVKLNRRCAGPIGRELRIFGAMRIIDYKFPGSVTLAADYFGTAATHGDRLTLGIGACHAPGRTGQS